MKFQLPIAFFARLWYNKVVLPEIRSVENPNRQTERSLTILMQISPQIKQQALTAYLTSLGLNPPQQEAVRTVEGPVSVLAGAGSGKTTAIVNRIAFMMRFGNAYYGETPPPADEADAEYLARVADGTLPPDADRLAELLGFAPIPGWRILAITFTNKAAAELKARLAAMLGDAAGDVWAATFHSACVRILRQHIDRLGYDSAFTIYDADDAQRVTAAVIKEMGHGVTEKTFPPKVISYEISRAKDRLITPEAMLAEAQGDYRGTTVAKIYAAYQQQLKNANALDFDDIIMLTVQLFRQCPDVLDKYQSRCRYLLVDEYQDTNPAQYELIRLLAEKHRNLCVVGDDDQSIYSFRGATVENILSFKTQFPDCKEIKLEQNYRSTQPILNGANEVIRHNQARMPKTLWTAIEGDVEVRKYTALDQDDEARFVADAIVRGIKKGGHYRDYAILYRTHALSNALERRFSLANIPYRVFGGLRFFERKEIKDVIAYMCVANNPGDTLRFQRIINEPKRGIGTQTLKNILDISADLHMTPPEVLREADSFPVLRQRVGILQETGAMFEELADAALELPLDEFYDFLLDITGYKEMLENEGAESQTRLENIEELKSSILAYIEQATREEEEPTLNGFLEEISLYTDQDRADESTDALTLMTVHSAKGLEFECVFLVGMEEEIFPSRQSIANGEIEEERRLVYVAITRAKRRLYITTALKRTIFGRSVRGIPSRFLKEMGQYLVDFKGDTPHRASGSAAMQKPLRSTAVTGREKQSAPVQLSVGDRVRHMTFGEGTLLSVTPMGGDSLLEIAFDRVGTKKIMANFARIRKV